MEPDQPKCLLCRKPLVIRAEEDGTLGWSDDGGYLPFVCGGRVRQGGLLGDSLYHIPKLGPPALDRESVERWLDA